MAAWLLPALKAVLPHVGTIVSAAAPVFTKKRVDPVAGTTDTALLQQQISELQTAAAQNSAHIRELAEQIQSTVGALERAAAVAEARLRRTLALAVIAAGVATGAAFVAVFAG